MPDLEIERDDRFIAAERSLGDIDYAVLERSGDIAIPRAPRVGLIATARSTSGQLSFMSVTLGNTRRRFPDPEALAQRQRPRQPTPRLNPNRSSGANNDHRQHHWKNPA